MWLTTSLENSFDSIKSARETRNAPLVPRDFGVRSITNITDQIKWLKSLWVPEGMTKKVEWITNDLIRKTERLLEWLKIDKQKIDGIISPVLWVILWFLSNTSIPNEVKDRYLQVAREAIDDLSEVTIDQINSVKKRQTEIAGPFASVDPGYYLSEILKSRVSWQLWFSESVAKAFSEERIKTPDGSEYQKENLGKYVLHIQWLDKRFGTHIHEKILLPLLAGKINLLPADIQMEMRLGGSLSTANLNYITWKAFLDELNQRAPINWRQTLLNFLKAGNLSELSIPSGSPDRYITISWEKIDLIKTLLWNNQMGSYFQEYENEARSLRSTAKWGKDWLFSSTPNFEWGKLISGNIIESMKWMDIQQIIILLSQLIPILPTVWSIAWAIDSSRNIANGISLTWEGVNMTLEWLSTIADTLDTLTLWVGQFGKLIKAKKTVELIGKMKSIFLHLPTIIEWALRQEKMTESKIKFIERIWAIFSTLWPAFEKFGINTRAIQKILLESIQAPQKETSKLKVSKTRDLPNAIELNNEIANIAKKRWVWEDVIRKEFLIGSEWLSPEQADRVINAHNTVKWTLGKYTLKQLAQKIRIMTWEWQWKLSPEQARNILKKWYAWKIDDTDWIEEYGRISDGLNKKWPDFLEEFSGKTATQSLLNAVAEYNKNGSTKELAEFLDIYDIKYEKSWLEKALESVKMKWIRNLMERVGFLKYEDIPQNIDEHSAELVIAFIREWNINEVSRYIKERLSQGDSSHNLNMLFNTVFWERILDALISLDPQRINLASLLRSIVGSDNIIWALWADWGEKLVKLLIRNKSAFEAKSFEALLATLRVKIWWGLRLQIDHFLKVDSTNEQTINQLKDKKSALFNLWNMDFEDLRSEVGWAERRLLMVKKWDISFFRTLSLENFFYMWMSRLDPKIYEDFVKNEIANPKWKYHTFIKDRPAILSVIRWDFPIEKYAFMYTLT